MVDVYRSHLQGIVSLSRNVGKQLPTQAA